MLKRISFLWTLLVVVTFADLAIGQPIIEYRIAFPNAVGHEAQVSAYFHGLELQPLELRMSRTSPGRYALHEFAKNVYSVKATDPAGKALPISRPNPHTWLVSGHQGSVHLEYTLFANRADGTYSQVNESHAHLNIPATFMYATRFTQRPIQVTFEVREDLNWKVATQLKQVNGNTYYAPNLDYFMDSPTLLADYEMESFVVQDNGKEKTIRTVLHANGPEIDLAKFTEEKVRPIVEQQQKVFGLLPNFDFDTYTFLYNVGPTISGDGMEHRNSTVITDSWQPNQQWGEQGGGTTSHEFFHCWNVERIRPRSLEPFDYEEANMSGELWLAEGFTSYYTGLILCRAGIISEQDYVEGLSGTLNYVWNSPGRQYHNVIEMSYQAPFVDAARSVDPTNRGNTFISYYSYGSALGLALDLLLRAEGKTLDGYMRLLWEKFGQTEIPYTVRDLESTLIEYAGEGLGRSFFADYIYTAGMPDYKSAFEQMGIGFGPENPDRAMLGLYLRTEDEAWVISRSPVQGSLAQKAGFQEGDRLISIKGKGLAEVSEIAALLEENKPGDKVAIVVERGGQQRKVDFELSGSRDYRTYLMETEGTEVNPTALANRKDWLGAK